MTTTRISPATDLWTSESMSRRRQEARAKGLPASCIPPQNPLEPKTRYLPDPARVGTPRLCLKGLLPFRYEE